MKVKKYTTNYGTVLVEECTRKEFVEEATELLGYAMWADSLGIATDSSLWIEYKDGSTCSFYDGYGKDGKLKSSRIRFGVIDNGSTYIVTGQYVINEDGIIERE